MAIVLYSIPKMARNRYNYVEGTATTFSSGTGTLVDTSDFVTTDWFQLDGSGTVHATKPFDASLGLSIGGVVLDPNEYYKKSETYSSDEIDALLGGFNPDDIDLSNYYTKSEVDTIVSNHETDLTDYYTKSEVDNIVNNHETDLTDYYTKDEVDALIPDIPSGINSSTISNWNTAYSYSHTHSNKSALDGITNTKKNNWDSAYNLAHTHENLLDLNSLDSDLISFMRNLKNKIEIHGNDVTIIGNVVAKGDITANCERGYDN